MYSSPHLIEVRERIRINGSSLSQEKFTSYFNHCFSTLDAKKVLKMYYHEYIIVQSLVQGFSRRRTTWIFPLLNYHGILCILERKGNHYTCKPELSAGNMLQVDVAVVEVGLGGEFDPTNVIK